MKNLILVLFLAVGFIIGSSVRADQLDAYPQGSQPPPESQPPPQYQSPQYQAPPQYQPAPAPYYEPAPRRRGGWRLWRRDYPDDIWSQLRIEIKAFYDLAGQGGSNNSAISNNIFSNTGTFNMNVNTAPGLGVEVFMAPPFGAGFDAGVEYEFSRNINNITNANGTTTIYNGSQPAIQFSDIYANVIFRWLHFYLPLGLNYTIPTYSGGSNNVLLTNTTVSGGLGFQIGLGYLIGEHFSLLLEDRVLGFSATSTSNSGNTSMNWGNVSVSGLQFDLKFAF